MDDSIKYGSPIVDLPTEIWTHIMTYLDFSDFKQARLVCKKISVVSNAPRLIQKSKFTISRNNLEDIKKYLDDVDSANCMMFGHVKLISLESSSCLENVINKIGPHVKSLTLHRSPIFSILNGRLPNLKHMFIGVSSDGIWGNEGLNFINFNSFPQLKAVEFAQKLAPVAKALMLYQLSRSTSLLRLERLHVDLSAGHEMFLLAALATHAETLRYVDIHLQHEPSNSIEDWSKVWQKLKQLHTIKLSGYCPYDWLESTFTSLSDQNVLTHVSLSRIERIHDALPTLIARKWPTSLQRLEMTMSNDATDTALILFGQLRENLISLDLSYCQFISGHGLLRGLVGSPNNVLRRLNLNDLPRLSEAILCKLAQYLPNLLELGLECCLNAVTNRSLANVFRYLTGLEKIVLDDCPNIRDASLAGSERHPWPISRLVGLRSLSLRGCFNITDVSLQNALKFSDLRHLNLGYCNKISDKGIRSLTANCPAIEDLALNSCRVITDDAVLSMARGLKRLEKLNLSNCGRLTERSLKTIDKLGHNISELTVCGINAMRWKKPQIPNLKRYRI